MKHQKFLSALLVLLIAALACNFTTAPASEPPVQSQPQSQPQQPPPSNAAVQILSPLPGATIQGGPLVVQYSAGGGPFVEVQLQVDGSPVSAVPQDGTSASITGSLSWASPTKGLHSIVVQALTINKDALTASIQINVQAGAGDTPLAPLPVSPQPAAPVPGANSVHVISSDTSDELGVTRQAVITLQIQYTLASGSGIVRALLTHFSDPACTQHTQDANGNGDAVWVDLPVTAGTGQVTAQLATALVGTPYAGVGLQLYDPNFALLTEDTSYSLCYAVLP